MSDGPLKQERDAGCRVCGKPTAALFGIDFKPVPICESCATQIAAQQVEWWSRSDDLVERRSFCAGFKAGRSTPDIDRAWRQHLCQEESEGQ